MTSFIQRGAARASRGLRHSCAATTTRLRTALAAARAWRWGAVLGRITLGAFGLILLGAIGRSALARNILSPDARPYGDAGVGPGPAAHAPEALPAATAPATAPPPPSLAQSAASPAPATTAAEAPRGRATADDPVYLNQATVTDLHRLPGVGPKRAEAIVALRTRLGHFRQVEDLLKVKGIGRSSLRKLRPLVRLDPPPARSLDGGAPDAREPAPS